MKFSSSERQGEGEKENGERERDNEPMNTLFSHELW